MIGVTRHPAGAAVLLATACLGALRVSGDGPQVIVTQLGGEAVTGRLIQVAPDVALQTDAGPISLAWADILQLRPAAPPSPPASRAATLPLRVQLADGAQFGAEIVDGGEGACVLRCAARASARVDYSALAAIEVLSAPPAARAALHEAGARPARPDVPGGNADAARELSDVAIVARGDEIVQLRGRARRIEPAGVTFEWSGRERVLPWDRLGGVQFARPSPRSAACLVYLNNGDCVGGRVLSGSDSGLRLHSGILGDLELDWGNVARIDCRSERLVFVSDLRPTRYDFVPFFTKKWDYGVDRSLSDGPIRLGARECPRGIAMHSQSTLVYRLDARFQQFAALAGIVDEMGRRGCVTLRVLGDGRTLWEATGVRGGQPPREVTVEVAGVSELALVVEFDEELDLSDQAAWGMARLIRKGP